MPVTVRSLECRSAYTDTGVVDEDIDLTEFRAHDSDGTFYVIDIRDL